VLRSAEERFLLEQRRLRRGQRGEGVKIVSFELTLLLIGDREQLLKSREEISVAKLVANVQLRAQRQLQEQPMIKLGS